MTDLTPNPGDSPLDPWTLEGLLDGDQPPADHPASPLAGLIEIVRGPGDAVELRDEAVVLAMFRESLALEEPGPVGAATKRTSMLSLMTRSKLVVAATAGALTLGAASAAAYSNVLPDSVQSVAHQLIKAPAPQGPDASGPAAKGLCTAFLAHQRSGHAPSESSVAFRNLATAAGGEDGVEAYCATVLAPTGTPTETAAPTDTATSPSDETATATTGPTTSPRARGQATTHPGQGAAQWTEHGRTGTFPGQGASHWPKATGKPGKGHPTTAPTTTPTTAPTSGPTSTPAGP